MKKKYNIYILIWITFISFSLLIMIFLWTSQVLFLKGYYRYKKEKDVLEIATYIKNNYQNKDIDKKLNELSFNKNVCIETTDASASSSYSSLYMGKGCFISDDTLKYKNDFIMNNLSTKNYLLINPKFGNKTIFYAMKLTSSKYAFINASIDPIDSTIDLLRNQFILCSIIVILITSIIALYIAKYVSSPIIEITKEATNLLNNNFNKNKLKTSIKELNDLSNTLSNVSKELTKMDQVKRDLMANVSHDMKTPLTMIKAYADAATELHANNLEKQKEDLNIIISEADRLTILVNDILKLSSMQEASLNLNLEKIDLVEISHKVIDRFKALTDKGYNFIIKSNKKQATIIGDYKTIDGVIYNLVNNAINYTGDDKKVTIDINVEKENITLKVIDTGSGINSNDIEHIWDKYYKSNKNYKRNKYGTGLGLSIVKSSLIAHNFKYGVSSTSNGTTFYFIAKKEK